MKAVRFGIKGKFAHFRRFYTNSSSLTYLVPPPPTLAGLVGAALGLDRTEYLERLSEARFAVRSTAPWRTLMQTVNLLMVTHPSSVTGSEGHTQVPTQLLVPPNLDGELSFEVLFIHEDSGLVQQTAEALRAPLYPPCLGVAYCPARVDGVETRKGDFLDRAEGNILGAVRVSNVEKGPILQEGQRIIRDRYPLRLAPSRKLLLSDDLLVEESGEPIEVTVRDVFRTARENYAII